MKTHFASVAVLLVSSASIGTNAMPFFNVFTDFFNGTETQTSPQAPPPVVNATGSNTPATVSATNVHPYIPDVASNNTAPWQPPVAQQNSTTTTSSTLQGGIPSENPAGNGTQTQVQPVMPPAGQISKQALSPNAPKPAPAKQQPHTPSNIVQAAPQPQPQAAKQASEPVFKQTSGDNDKPNQSAIPVAAASEIPTSNEGSVAYAPVPNTSSSTPEIDATISDGLVTEAPLVLGTEDLNTSQGHRTSSIIAMAAGIAASIALL